MNAIGYLLHVYNLGSQDWERLVWGDPARDALGVGAKLFECLLAEPEENTVHIRLYNGPSRKDGLSEGEYTRQFLLDRAKEITVFPRLAERYDRLSPSAQRLFYDRVAAMQVGASIDNTFGEICRSAEDFTRLGAGAVVHVAAASHAPRCIQLQARARENGLIPGGQLWYTVASDLAFSGRSATDTVVVEPPHRADDPLLHFRPTLASLLRRYFLLDEEGRKQIIVALAAKLARLRKPSTENVLNK